MSGEQPVLPSLLLHVRRSAARPRPAPWSKPLREMMRGSIWPPLAAPTPDTSYQRRSSQQLQNSATRAAVLEAGLTLGKAREYHSRPLVAMKAAPVVSPPTWVTRGDFLEDGMKRTTLVLLSLGTVLSLVCGAVGLRWAAQQAPDFYTEAVPAAPAVREEAARHFAEKTARLVEEFHYAPHWEQEFTQQGVNAWLAEELPRQYGDKIPPGVSDPRVQFADGVVRVGFQLSNKRFHGIVSLALRPSVPEPNRLAIRVESLYAGLLPLAPATFTSDVSKQLDRYAIEHEWHIEEGYHVLYVTVMPSRGDRPVLEEIAVDDAKLRIAGHRERPAALTMRDLSRPQRL
jgi:hypothetical protein